MTFLDVLLLEVSLKIKGMKFIFCKFLLCQIINNFRDQNLSMQTERIGTNAIDGIIANYRSQNANINILGKTELTLLKLKKEIDANKIDRRLVRYA
jgi:aspartate/glutamate racemase